ncbi:MAG: ribosome-associated translation inhibitor RaiA [Acidobacteria bacterium]|nr:MAG: ribosome-associated translation inhibitor RaiA [Acidobacteriota bacterium]
MRLDITGRHVAITAPLRQLIDKRLAKLLRVLNDSAVSVNVILTKEKYRHITEILIHARGNHMMRGEGEGNAWRISVQMAAAAVEQQAQRLKTRWTDQRRRKSSIRPAPAIPVGVLAESQPRGPRIVRAPRYPVKPMSVEDAALRVDAGPDTFVVFRNAETDAVSILYRRKDGNLGLIEPD